MAKTRIPDPDPAADARRRVAQTVAAAMESLERRRRADAGGARDPGWLAEALESPKWPALIQGVEALGLARAVRILDDSLKASKRMKLVRRKDKKARKAER